MAVDLCSDDYGLGAMSPRISFSHDISQADIVPVEQYVVRSGTSSSSIDFDFCVFRECFDQQQQDSLTTSADELFFNGQILPIEIKRRIAPPQPPPIVPPPAQQPPLQGRKKEHRSAAGQTKPPESLAAEHSSDRQKQSSSSFWSFKRSSSLNCGGSGGGGGGYARTLCPLPPLLSRSHSTGSAPSSSHIPKLRTLFFNKSSSAKQPPQPHHPTASNNQKPPLKKSLQAAGAGSSSSNCYPGNTGAGVRISPVLNVSPANLFVGIGSIFSFHGSRDHHSNNIVIKNNKKK
ncbi:unnamed protein product [Cuscuta europaea]|uniref:Uncharacterized protein n=1 Tax=Cuscuta europaea TaxID=41803 RepID=A0A9P0Z3B4_CUSEU|nr:unnamed protein product [Cuscuta europaea]